MLNGVVCAMSSTYTFLLLVLTYVVGAAFAKELPSYITLCHRNDPNIGKCVRNAVDQLRPHLADGVPQLLLPPLNPLVLPEAGLDTGDNFRASFKQIEVYYAHEFHIEHLDFNLEQVYVNLTLRFPKLRIKSQYNIDGRLLILQLHGQGPADGNFTDISANIYLKGNRFHKKGKEFLAMSVKSLNLDVGKPTFQFDNIFQDNAELNDRTNKIINENIVDIIEELKPVIDKTIIQFASGIIGRIFNRFSFDDLFPK